MSLSPEQKAAVSTWVAAGDNLSAVQKKLIEHFKLSLTYRDVRFLVDDLNLDLKDPAPKVDASDVSKPQPTAAGAAAPSAEKNELPGAVGPADADPELSDGPEPLEEDEVDALPPGLANVKVEVDQKTLIPGALASGSVTFSDGVTGNWVVDQYGRPGFTKISKEGYRPNADDAQAFMQELSLQLQQRGF